PIVVAPIVVGRAVVGVVGLAGRRAVGWLALGLRLVAVEHGGIVVLQMLQQLDRGLAVDGQAGVGLVLLDGLLRVRADAAIGGAGVVAVDGELPLHVGELLLGHGAVVVGGRRQVLRLELGIAIAGVGLRLLLRLRPGGDHLLGLVDLPGQHLLGQLVAQLGGAVLIALGREVEPHVGADLVLPDAEAVAVQEADEALGTGIAAIGQRLQLALGGRVVAVLVGGDAVVVVG